MNRLVEKSLDASLLNKKLARALPMAAMMCACMVAPGTSHATVFDLNADWSDVANPNGVWTYREGTTVLSQQSDWTPLSNVNAGWGSPAGVGPHTAQPAWAPSTTAGNYLPAWLKATATPIGPGWDFLAGDVVVHTNDFANGNLSLGNANVLFVAPSSGIATISGNAWNEPDINRPQAYELRVNGVVMASGALPGDGSVTRSNPATFNLTNVSLTTGDQVELLAFVGSGSTSQLGDFVGFNETVDFAAVPVPAAAFLFPSALGLLGLRRKASSKKDRQVDLQRSAR